ncbi:MAG: diphthamide biosynthesis enzyme Dph2 [Candidatus Thermoplasmatota archaeon]|jgi:2-(3-amino-3-carboxypropyl)histidine synthase|nr:diphthamide biosynthesis enzyme Dph2 [Candidatus Thermoplasmatota archaeon]
MKISGYNIDFETAVKTVKKNGYKTLAIQLPEGLKMDALKMVDYLEKETDANMVVSASSCFGACDVADDELKNLGVECIIHIGHTPIPNMDNFSIPIIFINALSTHDVTKVVEKAIPFLKGKKIGVVTTAQHLHMIEKTSDILKKHNLEPIVSDGDKRIHRKGQILGCNFTAGTKIADKVDSFLFIGSGNFHPLGLLFATKKTVVTADPYTNTVKTQELEDLKDTILKQRYGAMARSKSAKTFGILVGTKKGQQRIKLAYEIKEFLDSKQKKSYIIALNSFSPIVLQSFRDIDCFVSTACPRIAIDDYMQYKTPIITPVELKILFGKKKWEDYQFDQILSDN